MSEKRAEASRTNGSRSEGPKSAKGKNNVRFNALAGGLFAKQLVIPELGESPEEFDRIKNEIWNAIQPTDVFQEMLTIELVETWWRRQRIRRGAAADLRLSAAQIEMEHGIGRAAEVASLTNRFWQLLSVRNPVDQDQEEVRSRLESTSEGLEFLIGTVHGIKAMYAASKGELHEAHLAVLTACCGSGDHRVRDCCAYNSMIRDRVQVAKNTVMGKNPTNGGSKADQAERVSNEDVFEDVLSVEVCQQMLQHAIGDIVKVWVRKKKFLVEHERVRKITQITAAALPSSEALDRISRAEAAIDRRFHRALVLLLTLKSPRDNPKFLLP